MTSYMSRADSSELYHHGVKGMKWGVRNGPPYPLGSKNTRSVSKQGDEKSSGRKTVAASRELGSAEAIVIAAAALTVTAAIKYAKQRNVKKQAEKVLDSLGRTDIIGLSDLPKTKGAHTLKSDLGSVNPKFTESVNYQMNCGYCVVGYELRRRGFDVEALPSPFGLTEKESAAMYKGGKFTKLKTEDKFQEMTKVAETWDDGARGSVGVYFGPGLGHIFSVEKQNGKVLFVDPQTGVEYKNGKMEFLDPNTKKTNTVDLRSSLTEASIMRTDNLELSANVLKTVKKRKG